MKSFEIAVKKLQLKMSSNENKVCIWVQYNLLHEIEYKFNVFEENLFYRTFHNADFLHRTFVTVILLDADIELYLFSPKAFML